MHYEKITTEILEKLKAIVGPKDVVTNADAMQPYSHDEVTDPAYHHMPEAVVFAETAQQVSAIIKLANACHFPVVPRGAGTGLACGAVPEYGGIVLSLEKMNKILEINEDGLYAVVEPGVRTSDLQEAAEKKGLFYAGDPCSGDSCFIGGNIATNAGGNRAVKYGTTRHQVYSVEVVNPTGRIVNLGARLQKQSTGYSLDQLVIGSEGTLGIITKATLKLLPKPKYALDLLAIFDDRRQAMGVVTKIIKAGITPTCVEFMDNITIKSVEKYLNENLQGSDNGNYVIVEVEGTSEDDLDDKAVILDEVCTENGASSVLVADHNKIWQARKAFADGFISRLPQGYDTVLDGNESISAGQRQLLCIARVMLARPQMLILDEATSNIDTRTEVLVQRAFDRLMRGRTSFVVAHRLSTVRDADLICVVDQGRIAERGTHEELLAQDGLYRQIYESQFAPAE